MGVGVWVYGCGCMGVGVWVWVYGCGYPCQKSGWFVTFDTDTNTTPTCWLGCVNVWCVANVLLMCC